MNERIKELLTPKLKEWGGASGDNFSEELEQFAQLIVRECMCKIMQRKEEAIDNDWRVDEAMSAAISDISEHFGVEE